MAQCFQPALHPDLKIPKKDIENKKFYAKLTPSQLKFEKQKVLEKTSEKTMCREFARGMCMHGSTCIYVHELILSQLQGVYTFCINFQNSNCNLANCKFVHATIFEKEQFYRTGFLPPHTLAHRKVSNSVSRPPTVLEGTPAKESKSFSISYPPPDMLPGVSALPTSGCAPPDVRPRTEIFGGCPPPSAILKLGSPTKRQWSDGDIALATPELDSNEPLQKKCKSCDVNEFRAMCCKMKLEKLIETMEKYSNQSKQLKEYDQALVSTLKLCFNNGMSTQNGKKSPQTSNLNQNLQQGGITNKDLSQKMLLYNILKMLKGENGYCG